MSDRVCVRVCMKVMKDERKGRKITVRERRGGRERRVPTIKKETEIRNRQEGVEKGEFMFIIFIP